MRLSFLLVAASAVTAAACSSTSDEIPAKTTAEALTRALGADERLGDIAFGQTRDVAYTNAPLYRAFRVQAHVNDVLDVRVRAVAPLDSMVWIVAGDAITTLAENDDSEGTFDSHATYTAHANGDHWIVIRDYGGRAGTFHVTLAPVGAPAPLPPDPPHPVPVAGAQSCTGAIGAGNHCGGAGALESCCASLPVTGGSYDRVSRDLWATLDLPPNPTTNLGRATVDNFRLDKYEVTVGRMRAFFEARAGNPRANPPAAGAGANPRVAGSGWHASWNMRLPGSWAEIAQRYSKDGTCQRGAEGTWGVATWLPARDASPNLDQNFDAKPMVCIDWYTLFAFCAWDGGRLPTDAEWSYAAYGGSEQRTYAWGNAAPSFDRVVHNLAENWGAAGTQYTWGTSWFAADDSAAHVAPPGRKPLGNARWGHADLTGNVIEWMLDSGPPRPGNCQDGTANPCTNANFPDPTVAWPAGDAQWLDGGTRVIRGGSWESHSILNTDRYDYPIGRTYSSLGGRCARD